MPDFAVGAHAAALGILFGASTAMPAPWRDGAFVARHGSWNSASLAGFDVFFVPFADARAVGPSKPFLTGFVADQDHVHGRPRSLAAAKDGSLLVVDDAGNAIWQVVAAR